MDRSRRVKLAARWSIVTAVVIAVFWSLWRLVIGEIPAASVVNLTSFWAVGLPFPVSRAWDILAGPVWSALIVLTFTSKTVSEDPGPRSGLFAALFIGLCFGLAYGLLAGLLAGLAFGFIFGLVIVFERMPGPDTITGYVGGLAFGLFICFIYSLPYGLAFGLVVGLAYSLAFGIVVSWGYALAVFASTLPKFWRAFGRWLAAKDD